MTLTATGESSLLELRDQNEETNQSASGIFGAAACGGIFILRSFAERLGFPLPRGMRKREMLVAGIIGGFGFTVALFVSGEAFADPFIQGAAKMGAMLGAAVTLVAFCAGRVLVVKRAL